MLMIFLLKTKNFNFTQYFIFLLFLLFKFFGTKVSIAVDNYQGTIQIISLFTDKIEWFLDGKKLITKYNTIGQFTTSLKVKNLIGNQLTFKLTGIGGETISKNFAIFPQKVL